MSASIPAPDMRHPARQFARNPIIFCRFIQNLLETRGKTGKSCIPF